MLGRIPPFSSEPLHPLLYILTGTEYLFFRPKDHLFPVRVEQNSKYKVYEEYRRRVECEEEKFRLVINYFKERTTQKDIEKNLGYARKDLEEIREGSPEYLKALMKIKAKEEALEIIKNPPKDASLKGYEEKLAANQAEIRQSELPYRLDTSDKKEKSYKHLPSLEDSEKKEMLSSNLREEIVEAYEEIRSLSITPIPLGIGKSEIPIEDPVNPLDHYNMSISLTMESMNSFEYVDYKLKEELENASVVYKKNPSQQNKAKYDKLLQKFKENGKKPILKLNRIYNEALNELVQQNRSTNKINVDPLTVIEKKVELIKKKHAQRREQNTQNRFDSSTTGPPANETNLERKIRQRKEEREKQILFYAEKNITHKLIQKPKARPKRKYEEESEEDFDEETEEDFDEEGDSEVEEEKTKEHPLSSVAKKFQANYELTMSKRSNEEYAVFPISIIDEQE